VHSSSKIVIITVTVHLSIKGVKNTWTKNYGRLTCNRPGNYGISGNTTIMWVPSNDSNYDDTTPIKEHYVNKESIRGYYADGSFETTSDEINTHHQNDNNGYYNNDIKRGYVAKEEYSNRYHSNDKPGYFQNKYNYYYSYYNNGGQITRRDIKANRQSSKHNKRAINQKVSFSSAVSDDINQIWKSFSKYGHLRNMVFKEYGFHGSGVSKMSLGPGEQGTISLVMSWYYPYRDHAGDYVGQYYR